jgi:GTPase KRas protein
VRVRLFAEGIELARHFGAVCIETSAKQRIMVDEVFMELVRAIRKYNKVRFPTTCFGRADVY